MVVCTRNGCKNEYKEEDNVEGVCTYHPGAPVFHEGLKSWSCCSNVNKPELDFDEFIKIKGCATGKHTTDAPKAEKPQSTTVVLQQPTTTEDGQELFSTHKLSSALPTSSSTTKPKPRAPAQEVEEEDDLEAPVPPGTKCKRNGCNVVYASDEEHRLGGGDGTVCTYHPKQPIFHEGSKGYLCCKRRVLEFDEFLKIEGCKKGKHLFAPKKSAEAVEVLTTCRIDFYQTPKDVHVSVFAKKADQKSSTVTFEVTKLHLDVILPDSKRFKRSLNLYGPIVPSESSYKYYGTKVEIILKKADSRSWNLLEETEHEIPGINFTFGVSGRTGTVGGREAIVSADTIRA